MQNIPKIFLVLLIFICYIGCVNTRNKSSSMYDKELERFSAMLIGKFSSKKQSVEDSSYYHISLVMSRIWQEEKDGIWLYVEQAMASNPSKPYRQRVYHLLHPQKNIFTSDIYTIKNAKEIIGLFDDEKKTKQLTFEQIEKKDGCTVTMTYSNGTYKGGTASDYCPSDLRGAKYATTEITLKDGELHSWDRGFDTTGKQVWGAVKGGYIFLKETKK